MNIDRLEKLETLAVELLREIRQLKNEFPDSEGHPTNPGVHNAHSHLRELVSGARAKIKKKQ